MAWRIEEQVVRGEIDNRTPGRVVGRIWLAGHDEVVELELTGNPWRDLAGHVLTFTNPDPQPLDRSPISPVQEGMVGEMTASRKAKVPDCSMDELMEFYAAKQPFPWHWGNVLYLEWYSRTNGRVVIEAANYHLELDLEPAWILTEEEEAAQLAASAELLAQFTEQFGMEIAQPLELEDDDDDLPQSPEEAQADAEDARMQLLHDRVTARLERGEFKIDEFDRIYKEERARLMRQRGDKDPVFTPEELAEQQQWIEEMNAIAEEALVDLDAEMWQGPERDDEVRHPLVLECSDLAVALHREVHNAGWLPEDAHQEHPLWEILTGTSCASAKLAGALNMSCRDDEWPPDRLIAGNVIVRLKKARNYLRDALRGLDSADEEFIATPQWRHQARLKVVDVLTRTGHLLRDARRVLASPAHEDDEGDPGFF